MSRKQLEHFLEQERRHKLGASTTRFAVSPEESDEKNGKRLFNRKRSEKREESSGGRNAHIDELLEYKSETDRSRVKLGRKTRHQQAFKKAKQDNLIEKPNLKSRQKKRS